MLTDSVDKGRTWSPKRPLTELTMNDNPYNCARISTLPDGKTAVICDQLHGWEEKGSRADNYVWFSDDDGEHFPDPILLPADGIVPDKYRVLSSGRIIISTHTRSQESGNLEQHLWYSDDGEKNGQIVLSLRQIAGISFARGIFWRCRMEN